MKRPGVFPVFLKLGGKRVVVIGGGAMALEKVPALVEAGAEVTLISPEVQAELRALDIVVETRPYAEGDLAGAWYAVAAAPPEVNRAVAIEAERRQVFLNAVDDLRHADVYLGSILRRGGMTLALSSDGGSPALTALVRRGLEWLLPRELEDWMNIGKGLRSEWKRRKIPFAARRPLLLTAINAWHDAHGLDARPVSDVLKESNA